MPTDLMCACRPKLCRAKCGGTNNHNPQRKAARIGRGATERKRNAQHGDRHEFLTILSAVQERKRHRCNVLNDGEKLIGRLALHEFENPLDEAREKPAKHETSDQGENHAVNDLRPFGGNDACPAVLGNGATGNAGDQRCVSSTECRNTNTRCPTKWRLS